MISARGRDGVSQREAGLAAGLVHGEFLLLRMHRVFHGALADRLGCSHNAVGKHIAKAVTSTDLVEHFDGSVTIAPTQVNAVHVFFGKNAVLHTFHGPG